MFQAETTEGVEAQNWKGIWLVQEPERKDSVGGIYWQSGKVIYVIYIHITQSYADHINNEIFEGCYWRRE